MEKSNLGNPSDLEKNQILEAHEKAFEIEILGRREFDIEKEKLLNEQYRNINEEFDRKLNNFNMEKKMQGSSETRERSQKINQTRIKKMNARNELMDKIISIALERLAEITQARGEQYKRLLNRLLLQGMVKLLENTIYIKCRPEDRGLVEDVIPEAAKEFKEMFAVIDQQAYERALKEREGIEIEDDQDFEEHKLPDRNVAVRFIDELTEKDEISLKEGGIILYNESKLIVVNNTLRERLVLGYEETLPTIREVLFPSLVHTVPTLGYWKLRGRGEMIRLLLEYAGVRYEDKRYQNPQSWFQGDKPNLELQYPNLPYLLDGQVRMTESLAILRYVAEKWRPDLLGSSAEDQARIGQLIYVISDLNGALYGLVTDKDGFKAKKETALAGMAEKLTQLHKFIEKYGGNFLTGNIPRVPDFQFYEFVDLLFTVDTSIKRKYPLFAKIRSNISTLPKIQAYHKSSAFVPLFMPPQMMAVKQHIKPVLGYWAIRGRGQEIRWALHFLGVDYLEVKYTQQSEYEQDKGELDTKFPNLPYFIDSDTGDTVVESIGILFYVCAKYGPQLLGSKPSEKGRVSMLAWTIRNLSEDVYTIVFDKANYPARSKQFIEKKKPALERLNAFVKGHGGTYVNGNQVRITDFLFYEMSEKMLVIDPAFAKKYPELMEVRENFKKIGNIKQYLASGDFVPFLFPPGLTAVNTTPA